MAQRGIDRVVALDISKVECTQFDPLLETLALTEVLNDRFLRGKTRLSPKMSLT